MENQTLRTHFGELIRPAKYGFKLTRDKYLNESRKNHKPLSKVLITSLRERDQKYCELMDSIFEDEWWRTYRPEIAEEMRARALKNFDLNMAFFRSSMQKNLNTTWHRRLRVFPVFVEWKGSRTGKKLVEFTSWFWENIGKCTLDNRIIFARGLKRIGVVQSQSRRLYLDV